MGIPKHAIPDAVYRLMAPEDRAQVGRPSCGAVTPSAPSSTEKTTDTEKQLQEQMANLLNQRNIFYVRSRMDKKTSLPCGMPDFFIFLPNGRFLAVEAKVAGGSLSDDQKRVFDRFWAYTGQVVHVVWSFQEFVELLNEQSQ